MRDRIVDFLLLAALIVIAIIIVWTLFGGTFRRDVRSVSPPPRTNDVLANPTENTLPPPDASAAPQEDLDATLGNVQPVDLAEPSESLQTDTSDVTDDSGVTAVDLGAEVTEAAQEAEAAQPLEEPPAAEAAPAEPLPAGSVDLERIGFSFVTGGPGSCGIVLEAWTHVAVSDDILADYPCGSEFTVALNETVGGRDSFTAVVGDTMNASNSRTVNIYVGEDEPALEYGVREGRLEP